MKKLLVSFLGLSVILMSACGGVGNEKQSFIDATVEATCLVFQADDLFDPSLEEKTRDIYENHGFDASDDAAMTELTLKYQEDEDVQSAILAAIEECSAGVFEELEAAFEDLEGVEAMEEEVMEEEEEEEATE